MISEYDLAVVGAGAVGCALAREIAARRPGARIVMIEKEAGPARHQSGRNSGVAHAGFNAPPGTLKARLAVDGNRRIRAYCRDRGVAVAEVGTLVAATRDVEEGRLEGLLERGRANGVEGIELLDARGASAVEPALAPGVRSALHAPTGAVLDSRAYVEALAADARDAGVEIRCGAQLERVETTATGWRLALDGGGAVAASRVVAAAGLHADRVARLFGWRGSDRIVPFRGAYWSLRGGDALVRTMVYPVPDPAFPFLGIHLTPRVHGGVMLGPSALLAPGREAYSLRQASLVDLASTLLSRPGRRLLRRREVLRRAAAEIGRALSRRRVAQEASRLVRGIEAGSLEPGLPPGIRAQLVDETGCLVDDFRLLFAGGSAHLLNVVSPGLTCSLPLAAHVADELARAGFFGGGRKIRAEGRPRA